MSEPRGLAPAKTLSATDVPDSDAVAQKMAPHRYSPFQILLYHDGRAFIAEVLELPDCKGRGESYGEALKSAEQAMADFLDGAGKMDAAPVLVLAKASRSLKRSPPATPRKPLDRRQVSPVKVRLFKKFGMLSNRELAARVGLIARDSPVMLSCALAGKGTRSVRCAIALALDELPSKIWPSRSSKLCEDDDAAFQEMKKQHG